MSIFENKNGNVKIAHYAAGFGEPTGTVEIHLDDPNGYTVVGGWRTYTPEEAIILGREIILRAKKARALEKRWNRQGVQATAPIDISILDNEDKGAEELPQ